MVEALNGIMFVGASMSVCCVLGSRRSRSAVTVVSTLVMFGAMLDATLHVFGAAPLAWTAVLACWAMMCAAVRRWKPGASAAPPGPPGVGAHAAGPHAIGPLHAHHLLGLIVLAAQLAANGRLAAAGRSGAAVAAPTGSASASPMAMGAPAGSSSVLLAIAVIGGAAFVVSSLVLLGTGCTTRAEKGNLIGMSAMTAAMGLMMFG